MLTEISYVLNQTAPKWPTNPSERLEPVLSFSKGDVCNAYSVYHHMHNGTHVDAPCHFCPTGKTIDKIPVEEFFYTSPYIVDFRRGKGGRITLNDIKSIESEINQTDILCIYTGYADLRATDPVAFTDDFPALTLEAAVYLRKGFPKLKAIAIDVVGVDSPNTQGFPIHKALLDHVEGSPRTLLLFEDVNTKKLIELKGRIQQICAFPVRWEGAEAAPLCMVAISD